MAFTGFSREGLDLLARLPSFDRAAFQNAKKAYTAQIADPAKALVTDLGEALQTRISPGIQYAAKTNGSIAPINNDLRFNPEAAPYKDHLLLRFWEGPNKKLAATLFVRLSPSDVGFATGAGFDPARLDEIRASIDADGDTLADAVQTLVDDGAELPEADLKRVPAPYGQDHPHADLLRRKWLQVRWVPDLRSAIDSPEFVDACAAELQKARPVHEWLVAHVAG